MTHRRTAPVFLAIALLLGVLPTVAAAPAVSLPSGPLAAALPGAGTPHPRILLWPEQLDDVRERVTREPLTTLLASVRQSAESAPPANPADQAECEKSQNENREVAKAGAARTLAFHFVLDREVVGGAVVPLDPSARQAMGDEVRDHLLAMCRKSRIKVNPDRDLGTGHELLGYATAYDLLLGGGYTFDPADEAQIVDNLVTLASAFLVDYQSPVGSFLTNNHGLKGAASLGIAAIVLAEHEPPGAAPDDPRWPRKWLDHAVDVTDEVFRHTYGPGDGAYGESPHYLKFGMQNVFSFLRAWNRTNGGGTWTTEGGLTLPDLWTHPAFTRSARWLLDMTLPDGTFAPIDDGNGGEYAFWGAYPADFPGVGSLYWRWISQGQQDYGGSVDNRLDTIVGYDDSVAVAPPAGSATAFYEEGGSAVFRTGWDADATLAIVQGEHGAARELGRTREGIGQEYSAPHDHSDPGSLQLHADGEPLLVDGGYINYPWTLRWVVNKPSDHNMVLVDPPSADGIQESPEDTLAASTRPLWDPANTAPFFTTPNAASPVDGDAQIHDTLDSSFVDTASVVSSYGVAERARVERRTAFVDERFLVVADIGTSPSARTWTWPLHGNAGGSDGTFPGVGAASPLERRPLGAAALPSSPQVAAGGTFTQTPTGGQWTRPSGTSLTAGLAFDVGGRTATALPSYHEQGYKVLAQHTALRTSVTAPAVRGLQILYPTPSGQGAPTVSELDVDGAAALRLDDPAGDTRVVAVHRAGGGRLVVPASLSGVPEVSTDADLLVVTASSAGAVRSVWAEHATEVVIDGVRTIRSDDPGDLGVHFGAGSVDVVAEVADPVVDLDGLGITPTRVSGACGISVDGSTVRVTRGREARFTISGAGGTGAPAADPGPTRRVAVGTAVGLDGSASCDPDGSPLSYRWELVSAPAGSAWTLAGASSPSPTLQADRAGTYRVELVVTDSGGTPSAVAEVEVLAGPSGLDTIDGDLDGRFDAADPDADSGDLRFVPVTPRRVVDSRKDIGTAAGPWGPRESRDVVVAGRGTGVPDAAVAVVATTTVVAPSAGTHLTVHAAGGALPPTSSLNAAAGQTVANSVTTRLGAGGAVAVVNRAGSADVVMDVTGYFVHEPAAGGFTPTGPTRLLDSRAPGADRWGPGETRSVPVTGGASGVPGDAVAVVVNATAVEPDAASHLTLWPTGRPRPTSSALNFPAGRTVAGLVTVAVGEGGTIEVANRAGTVDVVLDVVGWYGAGPAGGELEPVDPSRLLDTRSGLAPIGPAGSRDLVVTGGTVPSGATAVVLNVTAVDGTAASHLTVWPAGSARPLASSLNSGAGATVANQVVVGVGAGGAVSIGNRFGEVDVVVDVVGWYR